jgi:valyl-tRNA synthetase
MVVVMDSRKQNIATLAEALSESLDLLKKKCPTITEDNYDKIKTWMQPIVAEWMEKPEQEVDDHLGALIAEAYGILLQMECMYMVKEMRKGAHG